MRRCTHCGEPKPVKCLGICPYCQEAYSGNIFLPSRRQIMEATRRIREGWSETVRAGRVADDRLKSQILEIEAVTRVGDGRVNRKDVNSYT